MARTTPHPATSTSPFTAAKRSPAVQAALWAALQAAGTTAQSARQLGAALAAHVPPGLPRGPANLASALCAQWVAQGAVQAVAVPGRHRADYRCVPGAAAPVAGASDACVQRATHARAASKVRTPAACPCRAANAATPADLGGATNPAQWPTAPADAARPWLTPLPSNEARTPNLHDYDFVLLNTSSGKDSQAMLLQVVALAKQQGYPLRRLVAVHCNLPRAEWAGTRQLAAQQAEQLGLRFEVVERHQNDLLEHIRQHRKFPGYDTRFCTSDHKRGPVQRLATALKNEWRAERGYGARQQRDPATGQPVPRCRMLNCLGLRSEEGQRDKEPVHIVEQGGGWSNSTKQVDRWLPIKTLTTEQVWDVIKASDVPHHYCYDLGMARCSCVFCPLNSNEDALLLAAQHNQELLAQWVQVEDEIGHTFRKTLSLRTLQERVQRGDQPDTSKLAEGWKD
jgi:3'-phosphoadenosine 5'-phosphosulfate sulfotransferase (PAPS reductase)/FAD synthetase